VTENLKATFPSAKTLDGAIVRLTVEYDNEWDSLIDESALRPLTENTFEFHLVKKPRLVSRIRLPANQTISSLTPLELLDEYWRASHAEPAEIEALQKMAKEIMEAGN
jgi:hypothetical protein